MKTQWRRCATFARNSIAGNEVDVSIFVYLLCVGWCLCADVDPVRARTLALVMELLVIRANQSYQVCNWT